MEEHLVAYERLEGGGAPSSAALVTGGASGIGAATVAALRADGTRVAVLDRTQPSHETDGVRSFIADLADPDAARDVVDTIAAEWGRLDVLVNCAGISGAMPVHETTDDAWARMIDVNLSAAFRTSRAALPHLARTRGCIINVVSTIALRGYPAQAAYAASKAGLVGLTRQMAADYGADGVRVNAVAPGVTDTPLTSSRFLSDPEWVADVVGPVPLQRAARVEDIAGAIRFLASSEAAYITGQVLAVDGGVSTSSLSAVPRRPQFASSLTVSP